MLFYRDGVEEEIESAPIVSKTREGHIVESYVSDGEKKFFVTLHGSPFCAHGSTIEEAITDALWKEPSKRPSIEALKKEIQQAGRDRKITLNEFRLLTGACAEGCRVALKRKGLDTSPKTCAEVYKHFPEWGAQLLRVLEWED